MAQGVCNHGDTTNNNAEYFNHMLVSTREADDLYESMLSYATFERVRTTSLLEEVEKLRKSVGSTLWASDWPKPVAVPAVEAEHHQLRAQAFILSAPTAIYNQDLEQADEFMVESTSGGALAGGSAGGAGFKWKVKLSAMTNGDYENVCECGRPASSSTACKHYKRALMACVATWRDKVKPWQTSASWERQQGPVWKPITSQDILEATDELFRAGKLKTLIQPKLELRNRGRPAEGKNASAEATARAKSFLEEMKEFGDPAAAMHQVLAGVSMKNKGGRGVPKTCSLCSKAGRDGKGHRANRCPHKLTEEDELAEDAVLSGAVAEESAGEESAEDESSKPSGKDAGSKASDKVESKDESKAPGKVETKEPGKDRERRAASRESDKEERSKESNKDAGSMASGTGKSNGESESKAPGKVWQRRADSRLSGSTIDLEPGPPARKSPEKANRAINHVQWRELLDDFKEMAGRRHGSLGDGFCWLYSFLGSLGMLQNPLSPTPRDYKLVRLVLSEMKEAVETCAWISEEEAQDVKQLGAPPCTLEFGNYGGPKLMYRVLSWMYKVPIITLDELTLDSDKVPDVLIRRGQATDVHVTTALFNIIRPTSNRAPAETSLSLIDLVKQTRKYLEFQTTGQLPAIVLFRAQHFSYFHHPQMEPPGDLVELAQRVDASSTPRKSRTTTRK